VMPGPRKMLRPEFPKRNGAGAANADVLNHRFKLRSDSGSAGSPTRLARCVPAGNTLVSFVLLKIVNGGPDCAVAITPARQPPATQRTTVRLKSGMA